MDTTQTEARNTARLNAHLKQQSEAARTGGTCPKCGNGANPTILAHFGHCIACQNATLGR